MGRKVGIKEQLVIVILRGLGYKQMEIARLLGVSQYTVNRVLKKLRRECMSTEIPLVYYHVVLKQLGIGYWVISALRQILSRGEREWGM